MHGVALALDCIRNRTRRRCNPAEISFIQARRITNHRIEEPPTAHLVSARIRDTAKRQYCRRTLAGLAADARPGPRTAHRTRQARRNQPVLCRDRTWLTGRG